MITGINTMGFTLLMLDSRRALVGTTGTKSKKIKGYSITTKGRFNRDVPPSPPPSQHQIINKMADPIAKQISNPDGAPFYL